jgi:2-methylcitrate dehydratase
VENIKVHISHIEEICDRPEPKTLGDLQFSFQNALAAILLDRDVNFNHVAEDKIHDLRYKEVRSKVEIIKHSDWLPKYAMETPARIEVRLKDGKEFSRERKYAIGSPQEPLLMEQFRALFIKFTQGVLPEQKIGWAADAIVHLEKLNIEDVQELNRVLVFGPKA